ncbi:Ni/Fe-hydrogenase cytochrome b subunit [Desulfothermus okinawensis JCM 13304]
MSNAKPLNSRVLTVPFVIGLVVILLAGFFLLKRFIYGLGPVSGMNDGFPWGLWIAYDVNVGTAFACGGYAMAILIYIFNKGEYTPLLKPAILTSMLGYTLAGVSIFFDIGRYWNMLNIFMPWHMNLHSPMLEVAVCIASYICVLWIEFSPVLIKYPGIRKRINAEEIEEKLNKFLFIFVALGMLLPTMHQSSLGTLMILAGSKLSPLYWSKLLPFFFLICAIMMGYAIVVFETSVAGVAFKNTHEFKLLTKISGVIPWLIGIFLIIRIQDINARGALSHIFRFDLPGNMFLIETLLLLIALRLLWKAENRQNVKKVFIAAFCVLLGAGLYRFDAYIIGLNPGNGWHYFPATPEIIITFGVIAVEILGYLYFVKKFPVLALPSTK